MISQNRHALSIIKTFCISTSFWKQEAQRHNIFIPFLAVEVLKLLQVVKFKYK